MLEDSTLTKEQLLNTPLGLVLFALGQELIKADKLDEGIKKEARFVEIDDVYKALTILWPSSTDRVIDAMRDLVENDKLFPVITKHVSLGSSNTIH